MVLHIQLYENVIIAAKGAKGYFVRLTQNTVVKNKQGKHVLGRAFSMRKTAENVEMRFVAKHYGLTV